MNTVINTKTPKIPLTVPSPDIPKVNPKLNMTVYKNTNIRLPAIAITKM